MRPNIKVENIHRQPNRRTRIRNIHNPRNMALHRRAAKQQIDLVVIIAEPFQILNDPQRGLAVRDRGVHVVLFPVLVDGETLEGEHPAGAELGFYGAGEEDGGFPADHPQLGLAAFHDGEFEGDDAGDFDGAAEGDLAVALAEVQVADGEFGALDVDREVDFAAAGEVLDVAVAAVFGSAGDCPGAFAADFFFDGVVCGAGVDALGLGGLGNDALEFCGCD
jgi:hypothetical protein